VQIHARERRCNERFSSGNDCFCTQRLRAATTRHARIARAASFSPGRLDSVLRNRDWISGKANASAKSTRRPCLSCIIYVVYVTYYLRDLRIPLYVCHMCLVYKLISCFLFLKYLSTKAAQSMRRSLSVTSRAINRAETRRSSESMGIIDAGNRKQEINLYILCIYVCVQK